MMPSQITAVFTPDVLGVFPFISTGFPQKNLQNVTCLLLVLHVMIYADLPEADKY